MSARSAGSKRASHAKVGGAVWAKWVAVSKALGSENERNRFRDKNPSAGRESYLEGKIIRKDKGTDYEIHFPDVMKAVLLARKDFVTDCPSEVVAAASLVQTPNAATEPSVVHSEGAHASDNDNKDVRSPIMMCYSFSFLTWAPCILSGTCCRSR